MDVEFSSLDGVLIASTSRLRHRARGEHVRSFYRLETLNSLLGVLEGTPSGRSTCQPVGPDVTSILNTVETPKLQDLPRAHVVVHKAFVVLKGAARKDQALVVYADALTIANVRLDNPHLVRRLHIERDRPAAEGLHAKLHGVETPFWRVSSRVHAAKVALIPGLPSNAER